MSNSAPSQMTQPDQSLAARLDELNQLASRGVWGQFHPKYMPEAAKAKPNEIDTSHQMSAVKAEYHKRIAEWAHGSDAALTEMLVNAYRSGQLITLAECEARVAAEREAIAAMIEATAYTSNGDVRSLEPVCAGLGVDQHHATIATAIRARGVTA